MIAHPDNEMGRYNYVAMFQCTSGQLGAGCIFLSHSSDSEAIALKDWQIDQGWNESFLDRDQGAQKLAGEGCDAELIFSGRFSGGAHVRGKS